MNIRRGLQLALGIVVCGVLTGCISHRPSISSGNFSALEVRALQTRTYEGRDAKAALKTVLNVLQDEGYLIVFGNTELGLLHATKTASGHQSGFHFHPSSFSSTLEATANVSDFGGQIKVRVSFQEKIDSGGGTVLANPIMDPKHYQDFFAKLERGLFIQKQGL